MIDRVSGHVPEDGKLHTPTLFTPIVTETEANHIMLRFKREIGQIHAIIKECAVSFFRMDFEQMHSNSPVAEAPGASSLVREEEEEDNRGKLVPSRPPYTPSLVREIHCWVNIRQYSTTPFPRFELASELRVCRDTWQISEK